MKLSLAAAAAAVVLLAGCTRGPSLPSYGKVPDFELTDQNGRPFRSREALAGRVWVANFIFTNCMGPCPRMSSQMRQVQNATSGSRRLVSFSIDPERDTPEALLAYSKRFQAHPGVWSFLTGPQQELNHLSKDVFMLQTIDGSLQHSTRFVLVDASGMIRGFYDSSDPQDVQKLITDVRALERAAA